MVLTNKDINDFCLSVCKNAHSKSVSARFMFDVLFATGLRYNDVSLCFSSNIVGSNAVVFPSKRNNSRLINLYSVPSPFLEFCSGLEQPIYRISYSTCVRDFCKCSPFKNITIGGKSVLLHIFRHNYMKKLFESGKTLQEIAVLTGEKNVSSVVSYVHSCLVI